jgi:hypothetical protein
MGHWRHPRWRRWVIGAFYGRQWSIDAIGTRVTDIPQGRLCEWVNGKRNHGSKHATVLDRYATGLGFPAAARRALGLAGTPSVDAVTLIPPAVQTLDDITGPERGLLRLN